MKKPLEVSDMPPLTREMQDALRELERTLGLDFEKCVSGWDLHDPDAAFEYARTAAIDFYNSFYAFYSRYPAFETHWRPASEKFAFGRVAKCIENYLAVRDYFERDRSLITRIKRTISNHASLATETAFTSLTAKQAARYAKAGIDLKSGSPLLIMAHEAALSAKNPASPSVGTMGEQIKLLREESNLTVEQIAELIGIRPRNVYRHQAGVNPRSRHVKAYEEAFTNALGRPVKLKRQ